MLHSRAGATDLAVADLRKAVELDPQSREARDALSRAEAMLASAPPKRAAATAATAGAAGARSLLPQVNVPQAQAPGTSQGGKRVALVIGNSSYQFSSRLANPGNDAQDISATLRALGFEVVEGRDLDRRGMDDAIRQFARKLDGAGLAILFYSGHGVQVGERNYLIPIDAKIETRRRSQSRCLRPAARPRPDGGGEARQSGLPRCLPRQSADPQPRPQFRRRHPFDRGRHGARAGAERAPAR